MKLLSLLLPTRGRVDSVLRLFESIRRTSTLADATEIVLYVDDDDVPSQALHGEDLAVVRLIRPRAAMGVMTRECYQASSGRYLMLLNDDVVFSTAGWDAAVVDAFGAFTDDIALVWGNDLHRGGQFPSHPFLSRRYCTLTDGPCPAAYMHDYIDTHIYDLFRLLSAHGHSRLVYLPEVIVEHRCIEAGKATHAGPDAKSHSATDLQTYILWAEGREEAAADLAAAIEAAASARQGAGEPVRVHRAES